MKGKRAVCFVDDDRDELDRFREFLKDPYIVGAGTTIEEALDDLGKQRVKKPPTPAQKSAPRLRRSMKSSPPWKRK